MKNTDRLMGKGTGQAQGGTIEMVMLAPVPTEGCRTDDDIKELVNRVQMLVREALDDSHAD